MLPILVVVSGCAVQGGATAEPAAPAAGATPMPAATLPAELAAAQPTRAKPTLPPPTALETSTGIQIAHVGVTAAGGLVDVRFKVLDAAKVRKLLGDLANAPQLIVGNNPPLVAPHKALHGAKYGEGLIFYILYPNVRSAVKPGVDVTVAIGDVRLGPVTAQ
jgi:hypothetical protein